MTITEMLKIQFYDSYNMLKATAEKCPDELWNAENHGLPVWNHIIHTIMGCSFWLREDYDCKFKWELPFPEKLGESLISDDWLDASAGFLTKEEISECFHCLDDKLEKFWNIVNDDILDKNTWEGHCFTYLSVISAQIRHIMCHVGMCSSAFIENGYDEIKWIAYGEN